MAAKVDLHIHSRFSDRSAEWIFRRFEFPDSYSDPRKLYQRLKEKGMTYVTFTDHNRIDGCLQIGEFPDVFISEEVTAQFPGDHVDIHLLLWNLTEPQHAEIQRVRRNVFELQQYLAEAGINHAVAHPLYDMTRQLTPDHVQKLILLFKHFEGINGLRDSLLSDTARFILRSLTPEIIQRFADRQGFEPTHPEPWRKILVAGSDDHAGIFPASAYTEAPDCHSASEFFHFIRKGDCVIRGQGGTPLVIPHGLYNTAYQFAKDKFSAAVSPNLEFLELVFSRFMEGKIRRSLLSVRNSLFYRAAFFPERFLNLPSRRTFPFGPNWRTTSAAPKCRPRLRRKLKGSKSPSVALS